MLRTTVLCAAILILSSCKVNKNSGAPVDKAPSFAVKGKLVFEDDFKSERVTVGISKHQIRYFRVYEASGNPLFKRPKP